MAKSASAHLDTLLQHTGTAEFDPVTGAAPVALPSMRTSTVRFQNLDALDRTQAGKAKGERSVTYGRIGMDTHAALDDIFCQREGARKRLVKGKSGSVRVGLGGRRNIQKKKNREI